MYYLVQLTAYEIKISLKSRAIRLLALLTAAAGVFPGVAVLLMQIMAVHVITRDTRTGCGEMVASLPYGALTLCIARALAMFCILLGLWPAMVIVTGILAEPEPAEWLFSIRDMAFLTLKYITTCVTSVGFVFLAGMLTRYPLWLYLMIGMSWFFGMVVASNLTYFPAWCRLFVMGHGVMLPDAPSAALGYFPQQELLGSFSACQMAISLLLLFAAAAWQMKRRGELLYHSRTLVLLVLITMVAGITGGSFVWRQLDSRESEFWLALQEADRQASVGGDKAVNLEDPVLEAYHLEVAMQMAAHALQGTASVKLRLTDASGIVFFTLRNYFTVQQVTDGNGEQLSWWRDGSRLAVRVPERPGELTLVISYSGQVWEWFPGRLARPTGAVNFIDPAFSLLRSGHAWYPVPGDQPLYTRGHYVNPWSGLTDFALWAKEAFHPSVPFELTVGIDTDSMVASNLQQTGSQELSGPYKRRYWFSSPAGRGIFLLTGPYQYARKILPGRAGLVEVYSYRQHQQHTDRVLASVAEPYRFYENLLQPGPSFNSVQPAKDATIVEVPPFLFFAGDGEPVQNLALTDTVLIREPYFRSGRQRLKVLKDIRDNKRDIAVLQRWWQADITSEEGSLVRTGSITQSVMLYVYTLYTDTTYKQGFYEQVKENLLNGKEAGNGNGDFARPSLVSGPVARDVFVALDAIKTSNLGELALTGVLRQLYQIYAGQGSISSEAFSQIMLAATANAGWLPEEMGELQWRLTNIAEHANDFETEELKGQTSVVIFAFNMEEWLP